MNSNNRAYKRISITIFEDQYRKLRDSDIIISRIIQRFLEYYTDYGDTVWRILDEGLAKEILDAEV